MEKIRKKLFVRIVKGEAFNKFVNEINQWWPKDYSWSGDELKEIKIDASKDGLCTEIGPFGFRCDWGRVTQINVNEKIELKWQIGPNREPIPDPEKASELEIAFIENGNSTTLVELEHRLFEKHGEMGEDYFKMMDSEQGWEFILDNYKKYCES
ncbi:hypothetical protein APR41_12395 [Salegentibacter salinarum]|uniref:Activator of Hsp90 ATPase homologue 1/2-like C-terminal domain-containing protein n=1 Tax=Salegentibacter salinarum TaxID=447422 RepID=A0A2N0U1Q2_9FLAO|nr:SRPBCC domain-containing protein [Salegentibacter salinarum]PKD20836.1 hypothetical protein APR41_12395 [Salegentibacter salinarum]SKB78372.1 Activator of Hsp90 ATPase homolog 1-like protein [Salegentibacter salinarum]